jgi:transcriptional regulator with XRE-family HTH domain
MRNPSPSSFNFRTSSLAGMERVSLPLVAISWSSSGMSAEYIHASSKPARLGRKVSPGAGTLPSTRGAVITPLIGISSPGARQRKTPVSLGGLDEAAILARIENGESIAAIAASLGADRSTLSRWLNAEEHRSARAREARQAAAAAYDEQAEQELRAATDLFQLAKARELAQHLRWRASKINPKAYGDRLEVEPAEKPETLAQAIKRLNDMKVPPHAPMPVFDDSAWIAAKVDPVPTPTAAAVPKAWRDARPIRRF